MFTGIIQATGEIVSLETRGDALSMRLKSPGFFKCCKLGDSVANDGVCLSVEKCTEDEATFCLMHQTVENTSFTVRDFLDNFFIFKLRDVFLHRFIKRDDSDNK